MSYASAISFPYSRRDETVTGVSMLEQIWHYVGTPLVTLALASLGGLLFKRSIERSNYNKLQETHQALVATSDAWEKAYKQRAEELANLTERFGRLQARFDEQERRHNEITALNVQLQLEIKARDITIADLNGKILLLEGQVSVLQDKLKAINPEHL